MALTRDEMAELGIGAQYDLSPLIDLIAGPESYGGSFSAMNQGGNESTGVIGSAKNSSSVIGSDIAGMTIGELRRRGALPMGHPDRVFAAGRLQWNIPFGAFEEAVRAAGLGDDDVFSPQNQEKMEREYLLAIPSVKGYMAGTASAEDVADTLSGIWMSLKNREGVGEHDAPGLNTAKVGHSAVARAVEASLGPPGAPRMIMPAPADSGGLTAQEMEELGIASEANPPGAKAEPPSAMNLHEDLRPPLGDLRPVNMDESLSRYGGYRQKLESSPEYSPESPYAGDLTVDVDAPSSTGLNALAGIIEGATAGNVRLTEEHPESKLGQGARALGAGVGMAIPMAATAGTFAPMGFMGPAVQFGAYEGLRPAESWGERVGNIEHGMKMGVGFGALGALGRAVTSGASPLVRHTVPAAMEAAGLTGVNMHSGMDAGDALVNTIPFMIGGRVAHMAAGTAKAPQGAARPVSQETPPAAPNSARRPARLSRTPQEMEAEQVGARPKPGSPEAKVAELREIQAEAAVREQAKAQERQAARTERTGRVRRAQELEEAARQEKAQEGLEATAERARENADRARARADEIEARRKAAEEAKAKERGENEPGGELYLGSGVPDPQQAKAIAGKAGKAMSRDAAKWEAFADEAKAHVPEAPESRPFSRLVRGETKTLEEVVADFHDVGTAVKSVRSMPNYAESKGVPFDRARVRPDQVDKWIARERAIDSLESEFKKFNPELVENVRKAREARERLQDHQSGVKLLSPTEVKALEADAKLIKEVGGKRSNTTDRLRLIQEIDGRAHDGPLNRGTVRGNHIIDRGVMQMADAKAAEVNDIFNRAGIKAGSEADKTATALLERYSTLQNEAQFLADPQVQKLMLEMPSPRKALTWVREMRGWYDNFQRAQATADVALGDQPLPRSSAPYVPKRAQTPSAWNVVGNLRLRRAMESESSRSGATSTEQVPLSHRMSRRPGADPNTVEIGGKQFPTERSAWQLAQEYAADASMALGGTAAIKMNARVAKYLELNGFPGAAEAIMRHTKQAYAGEKHGVAREIDRISTRLTTAMLTNKRLFDRARYGFNPRFSLFRQPSSLANYAIQHPRAFVEALGDLSNPAAKAAVKETYAAVMKGRKSARISDQADGTFAAAPPATKRKMMLETVERGLSDGVENFTVTMQALMSQRVWSAKGKSGKELARIVSDEVGKYQSFYDRPNRAGILNSRVVQGGAPAQGYSIDQTHNILELAGKVGADQGISPLRAGYNIAALIGAHTAMGMMYSRIAGYGWEKTGAKDKAAEVASTAAGILPFFGQFTGTGPSEGRLLSAGQLNDLYLALRAFNDDEPLEAYRYLARNWQSSGAFMGDVATGRTEKHIDNVMRLLGLSEDDEDERPSSNNVPHRTRRRGADRPRPSRPQRGQRPSRRR